MKLSKLMTVGAIALSLGGVANAAPLILHFTGSTAFRKPTIIGIENLLISGNAPAGTKYSDGVTPMSAHKFKGAYKSATSSGGEQADAQSVFEGYVAGVGPVVIKCGWTGSTGGLLSTSQQVDTSNLVTGGYLDSANLNTRAEASTVGDAAITGGASIFNGGIGSIDVDNQKPQVTMADGFQTSAGVSGLTASISGASLTGCVGIIPFEWVANNGVTNTVKFSGCTSSTSSTTVTFTGATDLTTGLALSGNSPKLTSGNLIAGPGLGRNVTGFTVTSGTTGTPAFGTITLPSAPTVSGTNGTYITAVSGTNPITFMTQNLSQCLLTNGGAYLSQFTGNPADNGIAVYAMGRNFDSGTRLSELSETAVGVFTGLNAQLQPSFVGGPAYHTVAFPNAGKGGGADQYIAKLDQWQDEILYDGIPGITPLPYATGQSGYNSGGDLAAALATPGSVGAPDSGVGAIPFIGNFIATQGGWLVGYLGWSDAATACKATIGPNTAHHISWNGQTDWTGTEAADGSLTHNANAIYEGSYSLWSYEFLLWKDSNMNADQKTVANAVASYLHTNVGPAYGGLNFDLMNVSKSVEGGVITHN